MPTFHHSNAEVRITLPAFVSPEEQLAGIGRLMTQTAPEVHLWLNYPGDGKCFEMKGRFLNENQELWKTTYLGKEEHRQTIDLLHAWKEVSKTRDDIRREEGLRAVEQLSDFLKDVGEATAACRLLMAFGSAERSKQAGDELVAMAKAEKERNLRMPNGDPDAPKPQGVIEFGKRKSRWCAGPAVGCSYCGHVDCMGCAVRPDELGKGRKR